MAFVAEKSSCFTAPAMSSPGVTFRPTKCAGEAGRFEKALVQTRQQILEVQRKVVENLGREGGGHFRGAPADARRSFSATNFGGKSGGEAQQVPYAAKYTLCLSKSF